MFNILFSKKQFLLGFPSVIEPFAELFFLVNGLFVIQEDLLSDLLFSAFPFVSKVV